MQHSHKKYIPFRPISLPDRTWPDKEITQAPIWCSVDLRDGNQALVDPMTVEEKLLLWDTLIAVGVKEIEVGFPSASETEFEFLRVLIDQNRIPDDVTVQVLVQARAHLIERTFEAIAGAKNVILHFYNSTSTLQRKVVFQLDMDGITEIAVEAARLVYELSQPMLAGGMNLRYEYSPESFMGTEMDFAVDICAAVMRELHATAEKPVILNLPTTVENCMPNYFADEIEYFIRKLPHREAAIISLHPHNDRGTGVATAELGLLAGAERMEATLFGNGERTGNLDMVVLALNMHTQGVDCGLDFSQINQVRDVYEQVTKMKIPERQPYVGELVFTAFSGSHQDAIAKGHKYMTESGTADWEVPYLPIDPADVGREYEPVVRINSQSGKGGSAFVLQTAYGFDLPKAMHAEFYEIVQAESERESKELPAERIYELFRENYLDVFTPYKLIRHSFEETQDESGESHVRFWGNMLVDGRECMISGEGNGPIHAFFSALKDCAAGFSFVDYKEHALSDGSEALAVAYIQLRDRDGRDCYGVGLAHNISVAPLRGILSALNRAKA